MRARSPSLRSGFPLLVLALAACPSGGGGPLPCKGIQCHLEKDGGTDGPRDSGPAPDLAVPPFCPGTQIVGTCAHAFFAAAAACWQPSGMCQQQVDQTQGTLCWASGARLEALFDPQKNSVHGVWRMNGVVCMEGDIVEGSGGGNLFNLTRGGQTLSYDEDTGDVTCPNGQTQNAGAFEAGCAAWQEMLQPELNNCSEGFCP